MSTWFTSDTHFGHRMVARLRGFAPADDSPEAVAAALRAHDDRVVWGITSRVRPGDDLFVLGDLMLGDKAAGLARLGSLGECGIRVHVVLGNHDRAHPANGSSHRHVRALLDVVESVQVTGMVRHEGREVL